MASDFANKRIDSRAYTTVSCWLILKLAAVSNINEQELGIEEGAPPTVEFVKLEEGRALSGAAIEGVGDERADKIMSGIK